MILSFAWLNYLKYIQLLKYRIKNKKLYLLLIIFEGNKFKKNLFLWETG